MEKNRNKRSIDQALHVKGESIFVDDISISSDTLFATVYSSPYAHCDIKIKTDKAKKVDDVIAVFTSEDIPGENQIGAIIKDEPLLAENTIHYIGQPVALIISKTREAGQKAKDAIELEVKHLDIVIDPRTAFNNGDLIVPPRTFVMGDVAAQWEKCETLVSGSIESGGQEHFYLETQSALALPIENDGIKVFSSTQSPTGVQKTVAKVLSIIENKVEVDVRRLGGGFGGKEDQASHWAALASMAAFILKKPVKLILNRNEDIQMTGKRHPYSYDYKIGIDGNGKIIAYEAFYYQNAGASADLSTAILERSLFHSTNTYFIPNVKVTAVSCRTNLPPFTAFRGFGAPQAIFVLEYAINKVAEKSGINIEKIQFENLIKDRDMFPFGMEAENTRAVDCWNIADIKYKFDEIKTREETFNKNSKYLKKGSYIMPSCFGISFTNAMLNQAGSLVHVYSDGSVNVSTGAVEMGQNVNLKIAQIVSEVFSIPLNKIKVETTNTGRVANTSPTAASSGADLNGKAAEVAANLIKDRLLKVAAAELDMKNPELELKDGCVLNKGQKTEMNWEDLVQKAYLSRTNLTGQGYYATPNVFFDRKKEKGKPFAYHVFGNAVIGITLDCLKGIYEIDSIQIVHDVGKSINPKIDEGQIEGAVIQSIGWMTMEELIYNKEGRLLNGSASGYKLPDIKFTPEVFDVYLYENEFNTKAVFGSKAVGEPPFIYGIGVYFAILNAMKSFRKDLDFNIDSPLTPEKILCALYEKELEEK